MIVPLFLVRALPYSYILGLGALLFSVVFAWIHGIDKGQLFTGLPIVLTRQRSGEFKLYSPHQLSFLLILRYAAMHLHKIVGACLLAFASLSWADSLPANNYLWGEDRMGKMVVRQATTKTTTTSKTSTSATSKTSTVTSATSKTSSVTSATSKASSTTSATSVASSTTSVSSAGSSSSVASSSTSSLVADAACTNGPLARQCWGGGYSVATDFDQKHPTTGNTKTYTLEVTNTTCNPDGGALQECLLINGQYPGPTITADWGDMLSITVKNSMQANGTSIHWHGVRQLNSVGSDGVNGVTECALAPGDSRVYTFQATQFGTSWYHSHYSAQYGSGVVGTIVINGPATSNYDVDLGVMPLTEWFYSTAEQMNAQALINAQAGAGPPAADNILVNGLGKNTATGTGSYTKVTVTPGKKHRLRLINTSVDNFFRVKLDSHLFTVIAADFIPVTPLPGQDWLLIAIGQRYDVIFTANATAGNYWLRVETAAADCFSNAAGHGRALFTYSGQTVTEPTDSSETAPTNGCTELVTVPYWKQAVDSSTFASQAKTLHQGNGEGVTANGQNLILWNLNVTAMTVFWDKPTLQYVFDGNTSYPASYDVIEIPNENTWTYWIIQEVSDAPPIPHPIHLHGHDFFVLGSAASEQLDVSTAATSGVLNFSNPPRRDTSILPGGGWLALAFPANNPGAWLMHCHIAWHISEGLGVQFLEAKNSIVMPDQTQFDSQCSKWKTFAATMEWPQIDSGL